MLKRRDLFKMLAGVAAFFGLKAAHAETEAKKEDYLVGKFLKIHNDDFSAPGRPATAIINIDAICYMQGENISLASGGAHGDQWIRLKRECILEIEKRLPKMFLTATPTPYNVQTSKQLLINRNRITAIESRSLTAENSYMMVFIRGGKTLYIQPINEADLF